MLLLLRINDTFHEHRSGGIYTISEIVSHMVLIIINSEGHFGSASSYDINEQWRLIEHIDVIVGTGDSKKSMQDPTVMRSNSFKDDCRMFDVLPCKLTLPTYWTVVSLSMHTIYAS
jgi:hypothetical protein